MLHVTE
jgi:hypothetical protein